MRSHPSILFVCFIALGIQLTLTGCSQNPHVKVSDPPKAQSANAVPTPAVKPAQPVAPVTPINSTDRDRDGVPDRDDICPDQPGPANNRGCPETCGNNDDDNDGVPNQIDQCPLRKGPAQNNGCPYDKIEDTDGDGVPDTEDRCPVEPGLIEKQGCPSNFDNDRDRDWVKDQDDKCPDVAGPIYNDGCPLEDSDGDGVIDKFDECPLVKGPASNKGCALESDMDGDFVVDQLDRCPRVHGPVANHGCPYEEREREERDGDADRDGVKDSRDQCKYVPGPASNYGCPFPKDEEREVLRQVKESLKFKFDSAEIEPVSFPALDRLAGFLRRHGSNIKMVGHTDDVGSNVYNQELSEARVAAVKSYLASKGIKEERIQTDARGESEPVAGVQGKSGAALEKARAQNRRVDMQVTYLEREVRRVRR